MIPTREELIGRHEVSLYADANGACELVRILWRGDVTVDEASAIIALLTPYIVDRTPIYVTDLSRLGRMPRKAMTILGGRGLQQPSSPRHVHFAFATPNLRTKVVVSLILGATAFTSRDTIDTQFFPTIDEAMEWAERLLRGA